MRYALAFLLVGCASPKPKVLLIFVDGFIPTAIATTDTPAIDRLMSRAAYSLEARAESTTISGSGYSTFLTGVHWDKHGVPDNEFKTPRYDAWPHLFKRIKAARPSAVTVHANCWKPIEEGLVIPTAPDHRFFHDYRDGDCDAKQTDALEAHLRGGEVDIAVIMFGELDETGHSEDNAHYDPRDPLYKRMLSATDAHIGRILDAIEARPGEDWLVILSADHGGSLGLGHGRNIPEHRRIPLIVSGRAAAPGVIWPPPKAADVVPTALRHLGVPIPPELDGRAVGFEPTARPRPRRGENLIFNGDAEVERGYSSYDGPDASVPGWDDPGWMTVIAYGAPDGFPAGGGNFFAGGREDSHMTQTIDISGLTGTFTLSAKLGGFSTQPDAATLSVRFLDAGGADLGGATIGPVTVEDRGGVTGLLHRESSGAVPRGAAAAVVRLEAKRVVGANDGYADDLSLIVR